MKSGGNTLSHIGELNWVELQTKNPEKAMTFYKALYDWTFIPEENEKGEVYWLILNANNFPLGGILSLKCDSKVDSRWVTYFEIKDMDIAIGVVAKNNGKIIHGPRNVPGVGFVAWLQDSEGGEFGVITPANSK